MNLDRAITAIRSCERAQSGGAIAPRAQLVVAVVYIVAVLTVPLYSPGTLVWLLCYPIIMAEALGIGYGKIFIRSLWALPFVAAVAIFNPILDREPMWHVGEWAISRGWVSFISVTLRGLLAMQALLLLVGTIGFNGFCRALSKLGVPDALVTQLMMLYRYMTVILGEAVAMHRARQSRGFGRKSYPLSLWATFVGQLLMRSIRRSRRISSAMEARGFDGVLPLDSAEPSLTLRDWAYIGAWAAIIIAIRLGAHAWLIQAICNRG